MSIMTFYAMILGMIGTTNMVLWGIYGDLLGERFNLLKVFRSLVLGAFFGFLIIYTHFDVPFIVILFSSIGMERITTELYKALWRKEPQNKYKIPSDFRLRFNVVYKRLVFIVLMSLILYLFFVSHFSIYKPILIILTGFFIALGGMLKDAPFEGFSLIKFFRSPIIGIITSLIIYWFFPLISSSLFLLSIVGAERICSEFYKKIFHGNIPGKFKLEVNKKWRVKRSLILPLYISNLVLIILVFIFSIT